METAPIKTFDIDKLNFARIFSLRPAIVSLILGLMGFAGAFLSINYSDPPITISIIWSTIFPLLAALAYGGRYGFIAGLLGLGAFFPFFIWPTNGWANVVTVCLYLFWFTVQGYNARISFRQSTSDFSPMFAQVVITLVYALVTIGLYPLALSANPPFWLPAALKSMPSPVITSITVKDCLNMWIILVAAMTLINVPWFRRLLGLPVLPPARQTIQIISHNLAGAILLWVLILVCDRIFINQDFPQGLFSAITPAEDLASVVCIGAGVVAAFTGIRGNTRRWKMESALLASEKRYRSLVDSSNDWIWELDPAGRYTSVSPHCIAILGYTPQEIIGKTPFDLMPPEEAKAIGAEFAEVSAQRRTFRQLINRCLAKDGHLVYLECNGAPVYDAQGNFTGYRGMDRDITDRIHIEEALQQSEQKFTAAFKASPVISVIISYRTGKFIDVNETFERVMGYSKEEAIGHGAVELGLWADEKDDQEVDYLLYKDREIHNRLYQFNTRGGQSIQCAFNGELVQLGSELCILASMVDVTEQKRAEDEVLQLNAELEMRVMVRTAQLETANRELEAFSYSISHDLRAPLRAINGFSKILMDELGPTLEGDLQHHLESIRRNSEKMDTLINDLLSFSRIGRQDLQKTTINMDALVKSVYEELSAELPPGRQVAFHAGPLPAAAGDSAMIRQVWINLIANALKFTSTRPAAEIEVGSYAQDGRPVYFIRDNGVGFDPAYSEKLFGVFQRLHGSSEFEGSGVGLAIVSRIIHKHGGDVWAEGQIDQGAAFYFMFN